MPATVHSLFPERPEEAGAAAHPLLDALKSRTLQRLDDGLRSMFDRADDLLFELSERAPNDTERRSYFDTMRVVRLHRGGIARTFLEQVDAGFVPDAARIAAERVQSFDLDSLSIQPTEELEERIALDNIAGRAEGSHRNTLWELERRLEAAQREAGVAISPQALHPRRLCRAFGLAIAGLDTDFSIKLVIYKLFERVVVETLDPLFRDALTILGQHGIHAGRPAVATQPSAAGPGPAGSASAVPPAAAGAAPAAALELLRQHGLDPAQLAASADPTAAELGGSLQTLLGLPSLAAVQASTQRLSMVSRLFDELLAEPLLPPTLPALLEPLRFPAYRAALTDSGFFGDAAHPLRRRIGELVELALDAQLGEAAPGRLDELSVQLQQQRATDARLGFTTLAGTRGLAPQEVESFGGQLREQARQRREAMRVRIRRQVAAMLDEHIGTRPLATPVTQLLRSGVGPLLALRLLHNGRASVPFKQAETLLGRVLASLSAPEPDAQQALLEELAAAFGDIGMAEDRVGSLLGGLREVYAALETEPPVDDSLTAAEQALLAAEFPPPGPAPAADIPPPAEAALPKVTAMELLSRVLTPESWFRVYDAAHEQTRWLKLSSFYSQQDSVTFSGFDEANRLVLHASRFVDDLAAGNSEPVNPTAAAREALEQLRQARTRGLL